VLQISYIYGVFFSLLCPVLHRIAHPVVSKWCQLHPTIYVTCRLCLVPFNPALLRCNKVAILRIMDLAAASSGARVDARHFLNPSRRAIYL